MSSRPTGVTILGALYILNGILALVEGLALAFLVTGMLGIGGGLGLVAGLPAIIIGIIDFIIAWGLLSLKGWGRILAIIFAVLGLLSGLLSLLPFSIASIMGIILIILNIVILWYLFKPEVKSAFQK